MKSIGLVITCYNEHTRPGKLWRAAHVAITDDRIGELVLRDDSGAGTPGQRAFYEVVEEIRRKAPSRLKLVANANEKNLGVFGNKLAAIRDADSEWIQSIDSDNNFDGSFVSTLFAQEWLPHVMFSPSFAKPEFDYRERSGFKLTLSNCTEFFNWNRACCLLNTGNQFMHAKTMRKVMQSMPIENFHVVQPDYFRRLDDRRQLHWRKVYDAADSFFFNKCWLEAGNEVLVVPELQYSHEVHAGSSWKAAPAEKDILPIIYALQLMDRAKGDCTDYLLDAVGIAHGVMPPLGVPPRTRVAVLTRLKGSSEASRVWVTIDKPQILRTQLR